MHAQGFCQLTFLVHCLQPKQGNCNERCNFNYDLLFLNGILFIWFTRRIVLIKFLLIKFKYVHDVRGAMQGV